jgi:hypothetical protein
LKQPAFLGVGDHALDGDDDDLARGALLEGHFFELVGVGDGSDQEAGRAAASNDQENERDK